MDGRGRNRELVGDLASYGKPQRDVLIHYTNPPSPGRKKYQTRWVPLAPGYSVPPGYMGGLPSPKFGPEVSFGRAMADHTSGRRVAIIKVSHGGTNLRNDWDPSDEVNGPKGPMYRGFETAVPKAIKALQAQGHSVEIRGMIWHQGEGDESAGQAAYEENLTELIETVRQELGYPHLPFLIGELESFEGGREHVRTAQANVAAAMDFVEFVPSEGLAVFPDGTHFTTASQIEFGKRFAAKMQKTMSNVRGDYNRDGVVDDADHAVWKAHSAPPPTPAPTGTTTASSTRPTTRSGEMPWPSPQGPQRRARLPARRWNVERKSRYCCIG